MGDSWGNKRQSILVYVIESEPLPHSSKPPFYEEFNVNYIYVNYFIFELSFTSNSQLIYKSNLMKADTCSLYTSSC